MDSVNNKKLEEIKAGLKKVNKEEGNWWGGWMKDNGIYVEKRNFIIVWFARVWNWLIYDSFGRKAKREMDRINYLAFSEIKDPIVLNGDGKIIDPKTYNPKTKCPTCGKDMD